MAFTDDLLANISGYKFTNCTGDTLVKTGAGYIHTISICPTDAAATAGTIVVYDNTSETGTVIATIGVAAAYQVPTTIHIDAKVSAGIYVGFTTTNDVNVTISYK